MVNIAEQLAAAVKQARRWHKEAMLDRVTLQRGVPALDRHGTKTVDWASVYSGPGIAQTADQPGRLDNGHDATVSRRCVVKIPVADIDGKPADGLMRVQVHESRDPNTVGVWRVEAWSANTFASASKLECVGVYG